MTLAARFQDTKKWIGGDCTQADMTLLTIIGCVLQALNDKVTRGDGVKKDTDSLADLLRPLESPFWKWTAIRKRNIVSWVFQEYEINAAELAAEKNIHKIRAVRKLDFIGEIWEQFLERGDVLLIPWERWDSVAWNAMLLETSWW
eukprot:SAG31_NODE_694_length_12769_cov_8.102447_2_plen_145_part_00